MARPRRVRRSTAPATISIYKEASDDASSNDGSDEKETSSKPSSPVARKKKQVKEEKELDDEAQQQSDEEEESDDDEEEPTQPKRKTRGRSAAKKSKPSSPVARKKKQVKEQEDEVDDEVEKSDEEQSGDDDEPSIQPKSKTRGRSAKKSSSLVARKKKQLKEEEVDDEAEQSDDDDDGEPSIQPKRKTRGRSVKKSSSPVARKKKQVKEEEEVEVDDEAEQSEKESDEDEDEPSIQPKRKTRGRSAAKKPRQQGSRGPEENRTCPHCDKICSTIHGLKYHVVHKVCFKAKAKAAAAAKEKSNADKAKPKAAAAAEEKSNADKAKPKASAATKGKSKGDKAKPKASAAAKGKSKRDKAKPKASAATKGGKSKDNDDDDDDEEDNNEDEYEESDDDKEEDDDEIPTSRAARRTKRVQQPKAKAKTRGTVESRTCPHCGKISSSQSGLKYHVEKFVCRKSEADPITKAKRAASKKRGRSPAALNTISASAPRGKRFRGSKEDRICSNCKREFTSQGGRDYHVKHRVCKDKKNEIVVGSLAFRTLETGSKFVTSYGVVEVVADDRVTPTYEYPDNIKKETKAYTHNKEKQTAWKRRIHIACGFQSRLRRRRLARAFEFDNINQDTTRKAYFGGSAAARESIARDVMQEPPVRQQDPLCPPEACPDRIVVCKPMPDCRPTFYSLDQEVASIRNTSCFASNLYLRRQDLKKIYSADLSIYICPDCGRDFNSREGYSYHIQSNVCFNRSKARGVQRSEINDASQLRFERFVKRNNTKKQKKLKVDTAVYPQVWLSLGFKMKTFKKDQYTKGDEITVERRVKQVDQTLQNLRDLVELGAMKTNSEKLGAMYPQVFKALGFKKPSKKKRPSTGVKVSRKKRKSRKAASVDEAEEAEEETEGQHEEEAHAPPQIMDMHVLIDEARSGRYPSIQRYTGDYPDGCVICKKDGKLLLCDFCSNAVHLKCLLTRVTFNELDPEEDFLCHSCARKIVSRRNRAEKRRLQKQQTVLDNARQKAANSAVGDTEQSDYHVAAAVGKELSELLELLEDSRNKLHHMTEASRLNNFRRAQL